MTTTKHQTIPFVVHSTFRDYKGQLLRPDGLEWDLDGDSHVTFFPAHDADMEVDLEDPNVKRGIIEAHNRWIYAKELPFQTVDDIQSLSKNRSHVLVEWKQNLPRRFEKITRHHDNNNGIAELIKNDDAAQSNEFSAEVWMNGEYISILEGPDSLPPILKAVDRITSAKLCLKRSEGLIRIEKYFSGYLRDRGQVYDHVMDNLIAMEDPQILDEQTLIGTATLPDWIMGGNLTSRLYIQEQENGNMLFLRPLRNDDIATSDRRFELQNGRDDAQIEQVKRELKRLRRLALVTHPFVSRVNDSVSEEGQLPLAAVRKELGLIPKRRKFFGL